MIPYFDAHCDTIFRCDETGESLGRNSGQVDLSRAAAFSRYGQLFALYYDARLAPPQGMLPVCRRLYDRFCHEMAENRERITVCRTGVEAEEAARQGKAAAVLSMEGGDLLACDPGRIPMAGEWGVRFLNLTWNRANALCGSHCEEPERGLTPQGRDFVRAMEANGILADVSHLSETGFWDLLDMAQKPLVASHSNARAICDHSRNLTDDQFRAIRDSGGVVGLNLYTPFVGGNGDVEALTAHVEHFLDLGGEKTVCLGGDLDGCDNESCGLRGIEDIHKLYEALEARHYSHQLLEDIFWGNLARILT